MKKLAVLLAFLGGFSASANSEIASVIKYLSPKVDNKTALKYAIIIDRYSQKYEVDWKIATAIFRQESGFDLGAVNFKTGDFGIGQINYRNIEVKKIDLGKLMTNPDYAIRQSFEMLRDLKEDYGYEKTWFTRYHSFTPKLREKYLKQDLNRWFVAIERFLDERREEGTEISGERDRGIYWQSLSKGTTRKMQAIIRRDWFYLRTAGIPSGTSQ